MRNLLLTVCVVLGMSATAQDFNQHNWSDVYFNGEKVGWMLSMYNGYDASLSKVITLEVMLNDSIQQEITNEYEADEIVFSRKLKREIKKQKMKDIEKMYGYIEYDTEEQVSSAGKLYIASEVVLYSSLAISSNLIKDNPESAIIVSVVGGVSSFILKTIGHIHLSLVGYKIRRQPTNTDKSIDWDWQNN